MLRKTNNKANFYDHQMLPSIEFGTFHPISFATNSRGTRTLNHVFFRLAMLPNAL